MKLVQKGLAKQENREEYCFKPKISPVSKALAERRRKKHQDVALHDRLIQQGEDARKRRKKRYKLEQEQMFKPKLSKKSKEILEKKKEGLVRVDNGQTQNLDFFHAIPTDSLKKNLPSRAKLMKLNKNKSRTPAKKSRTTIKSRTPTKKSRTPAKKSRTPRKKNSSKYEKTVKKRRDPHPEYMSPYNKKVMSSKVPLNSVLAKSKLHRQHLKMRKDDKNAKRKKDKALKAHNDKVKKRLGYIPNQADLPLKKKSNPLDFYKSKKSKKNGANRSPRKSLVSRQKSQKKYGNDQSQKNSKKFEQSRKRSVKSLIYNDQEPNGDIDQISRISGEVKSRKSGKISSKKSGKNDSKKNENGGSGNGGSAGGKSIQSVSDMHNSRKNSVTDEVEEAKSLVQV